MAVRDSCPKRARPVKISVLVAACSVETVTGPLLLLESSSSLLLLLLQSSSSLLLFLQSSSPLLLSLQSSSWLLLPLQSSSPLLLLLHHCREDVMVLVYAGSFDAASSS